MKLSNEIKTAILVLSGILMFIVGFSYLKSNNIFSSDRTFFAIYDDIEGVSVGTPVTVSGFNVGSIQDISFYQNTMDILVKFRVENKVKFSKNSVAQIYETGLIGGKALAILPNNGPLAQSGDTLRSSIAPGLTELVNDKLSPLQEKIESTFVSADSLLKNINNVLDVNSQNQIKESFSQLSDLAINLKESAENLNSIINSNEIKINDIVSNVDNFSSNFSSLSNSFSDVEVIIGNLTKTSNNLNSIIDEISSGDGTFNQLIYDDSMIKSLNEASNNLNLLMEDLRLNPKRYVHFSLFGKKNKEYQSKK
jgi:phospholipid/cholesterol/gamma-HCH transport system substrate-binding protein|tara:strand:- start:598 stop:1524 length:927 start_codon:yes stop_codon:yes gene_type:complete